MSRKSLVPLALIIVVLAVGSGMSNRFLDPRYLMESATLVAEIGIMAMAMNFVITAGQIDLSVGSNMILCACLTAKMLQAGVPPFVAIPLCLIMGSLLGWLNGFLTTRLNTPSFLVTVGTMAVYRGTAQAILGPSTVKFPEQLTGIDTSTFAGLTIPLIVLALAALTSGFVFSKTVFGRWVTAVGSNASTALYSGVPVQKVTTRVFVIAGFASGLAGLLLASRLGVARHDLLPGCELDVITIVVVGGTAIRGGDVNVLGTMLAFITLALMRTAMGVRNLSAEYQLTAIGILLVFAVIINRLSFKNPFAKPGSM